MFYTALQKDAKLKLPSTETGLNKEETVLKRVYNAQKRKMQQNDI